MTLHPSADAELKEAAQYYESREPGLCFDFLREVERALDQILTNPVRFSENRQENTAEVLMAVPLQGYVCSLSRTNPNRRIRPPEAATFLLAEAAKEHTRMGSSRRTINLANRLITSRQDQDRPCRVDFVQKLDDFFIERLSR